MPNNNNKLFQYTNEHEWIIIEFYLFINAFYYYGAIYKRECI